MRLALATCVLLLIAKLPLKAEEIPYVFGMSTALTGPTGDLGTRVRAGVLAAFEHVNRAGGLNGHPLRLLALDDGYEPRKTAPNMRTLIEKENVLAVIGNVGAPCAVAAVPIANETKTPLFAYVTGGSVLRKTPPDRYVINYRASLVEEAEALVDGFVKHAGIPVEAIAFFTQRDTFGDSTFQGGIGALKRHGLKDERTVVHARYERNTLAVENGLSEILLAGRSIQAVVIGGSGPPSAAFIRAARREGLKAHFGAVSFVEAAKLVQDLGSDGDGVIVTQVVPHPESDLPLVREYRAALKALDPEMAPSFISLEGYLAARILLLALSRIQGDPTRETITDALRNLGSFDLGLNVPLKLCPEDHQASHHIWPTVLRTGRVVPLNWSKLLPRGKTHP